MAERPDTSPEQYMDIPSEERMDTSSDAQDSFQTMETARIYSEYDQNAVPPHPGPEWTRFVCMSDTHSSRRYFVPPGDVLLHAGDLSSNGTPPKLTLTIDWLMAMPHPAKVIIAGNHDACLDRGLPGYFDPLLASALKRARKAGLFYLEYESLVLTTGAGRQWKIYGSPAVPAYRWGAFLYSDAAEADAIYSKVPDDAEIVMMHGPPFGILDLTRRGSHAGCKRSAARLRELRSCRLCVFGHIHEAYGARFANPDECFSNGQTSPRVFANAAIYLNRVPVIVDLKN